MKASECFDLPVTGRAVPEQTSATEIGCFDVDPQSGEIRCEGKTIELQNQPFQVVLVVTASGAFVAAQ
jgi:hypothetical protein